MNVGPLRAVAVWLAVAMREREVVPGELSTQVRDGRYAAVGTLERSDDTASRQRWLAGRLAVGAHIRALLFDLDGVLIDSLAHDYSVVESLLASYGGEGFAVSREVVRRWFAWSLDDFWAGIVGELGVRLPEGALAELVGQHERLRRQTPPTVHTGVMEILAAAGEAGLRRAVVSNNSRLEVEQILKAVELLSYFDVVVGNDEEPGFARKPAPDAYLLAARRLGIPPEECVAIEDSVLGLESAHRAGCSTVGVATGATALDTLVSCGYADHSYLDFSGAGEATHS